MPRATTGRATASRAGCWPAARPGPRHRRRAAGPSHRAVRTAALAVVAVGTIVFTAATLAGGTHPVDVASRRDHRSGRQDHPGSVHPLQRDPRSRDRGYRRRQRLGVGHDHRLNSARERLKPDCGRSVRPTAAGGAARCCVPRTGRSWNAGTVRHLPAAAHRRPTPATADHRGRGHLHHPGPGGSQAARCRRQPGRRHRCGGRVRARVRGG